MSKFISKLERKYFKLSFKNILYLLFVWFCVGFTLGTGILMGPVRWLTNIARDNQWAESTEKILVLINILLLIVVSLVITILIVKAVLKSKKIAVRVGVSAILGVITLLVIWMWMTPSIMITENEGLEEVAEGKNAEFHFGNYPGEEELMRLKADSFTGVISLLHPAVVPFEPKLIAEEKSLAAKIGIEVIHIPMLPWVAENKDGIDRIKDLAVNGKGKYFVHCYLGKDRVNVVKRIIRSVQDEVLIVDNQNTARSIDDRDSFERGAIFELGTDVYFTPYPTDEEYFGYVLSGSFTRIVSLLDPDNPEDLKLINKEKKTLEDYQIIYELMPISFEPYDPEKTLRNVQKIKSFKPPLLIHAFFTKGRAAEVFMETYKSGIPSIAPVLFESPLKSGEVAVLVSNIVAGNIPSLQEIEEYLYINGIRKIAYTGSKYSSRIDRLIAKAEELGITWEDIDLKDPDQVSRLKKDGPWYLFGSSIEDVSAALE